MCRLKSNIVQLVAFCPKGIFKVFLNWNRFFPHIISFLFFVIEDDEKSYMEKYSGRRSAYHFHFIDSPVPFVSRLNEFIDIWVVFVLQRGTFVWNNCCCEVLSISRVL